MLEKFLTLNIFKCFKDFEKVYFTLEHVFREALSQI